MIRDLQFLIDYNKNREIIILPGQGDQELYKKNVYEENDYILSPDVERYFEFNIIANTENIVYHVEISIDTLNTTVKPIIKRVIDTFSSTKILDTKFLQKIINHNTKALKNVEKLRNNIPIPNDLYIDELTWDFVTSSIKLNEYPLLIGPKGCGKTSTGHAVAKALGYNFYAINCATLLKPKNSLVGNNQAKDASTFFVESLFLKHYISEEPTIIYLQELSRIPKLAANYLMTMTEQPNSYLYIEDESRLITKGSGVTFMADANFGAEYIGTGALDGAFLDRFVSFMVDYLSEDEEIKLILQRIPSIKENDVIQLVKLANKFRSMADTLQIGVSTRKLLSMSKYLQHGFTVEEIINKIFKNIFINGTQSNSEEINQIFNSQ